MLQNICVEWMIHVHIYVAVQFHPWFSFYLPLFLCMVMCENEQKQRKIKIEPRIKLRKYTYMSIDYYYTRVSCSYSSRVPCAIMGYWKLTNRAQTVQISWDKARSVQLSDTSSLPALSPASVPFSRKLAELKGHSHAILVHFKNQKYVLTSMNAHK